MGVPPSSLTSSYSNSATSSSSYLSPVEAAVGHRPVPPANPSAQHPTSSPQPNGPAHNNFLSGILPSRTELPRIIWHINPSVKIKLRKRFYPLGLTRLTLGADLDVKTHDVSLKWSWKDRIFGSQLEFFNNQLSLTKSFPIDRRSKVDVRAAYDIITRRTLFSFRVLPFWGIVPNDGPPMGLRIKQKVKVDRHLAVELQGKLILPEARFSNETTTAVSLGEGDFVFNLQKVNFRFMLQ